MSINKLVEYLSATPAQRQRILKQQKNPPTYLTTWYGDAERAIVSFLLRNQCGDLTVLKQEANRVTNEPTITDAEKTRNQTNGEALTSFIAAVPNLDLARFTFRRPPQPSPKLTYSGVEISVRPEVLIQGQDRKGKFSGSLKLHISKHSPFDANAAAYVGAILHEFTKTHGTTPNLCRSTACCVVDVFGQTISEAPRAMTKRLKEVQAACKEIATVWPSV